MTDSQKMQIAASRFRFSLANPIAVQEVSGGIAELLGFTAADFMAGTITLQSRFHAQDQDIADVLFSPESCAAATVINIRLRQADGRIRCVRCQYTKTPDAVGKQWVLDLLLEDAKTLWQQQQQQQQQAMLPTNLYFNAMMNSTDGYIYFKDRNHVFIGASQTLMAITSLTGHWTDLLGLTDYDVFPENFADSYYSLEKQVFAGKKVAQAEQQTLSKDGSSGWVENRKYPLHDQHGEIVGLFGIARDITPLKLAEIAIQEQAIQFRHIFDAAPIGIALIDSHNGHIYQVNAAFANIAGRTVEQMQNIDWMSITHKDDIQADLANMHLFNAGNIPGFQMDKRYLHPDGTLVWVSMTIAPFTLGANGEKRHLCMVEDITLRRQTVFEVEQLVASLTSKNQSLTSFNNVAVGRELRMIEIKREVNELLQKLERPPRYELPALFPPADAAAST